MNTLKRLHQGKFNTMNQEWQPDGSVRITLVDRLADKVYKFRAKDLYGENEQEVDIDTGQPIAE